MGNTMQPLKNTRLFSLETSMENSPTYSVRKGIWAKPSGNFPIMEWKSPDLHKAIDPFSYLMRNK